jgi:hypothetical protein
MPKLFPAARRFHFQGQILLERALFCVGCEIIFTGTTRCPRCGSVEAVWPMAEWLGSARPSQATTPQPVSPRLDTHAAPRAQRTLPAA